MMPLQTYASAVLLAAVLSVSWRTSLSFQPSNLQIYQAPFRYNSAIKSTYSSEIIDQKSQQSAANKVLVPNNQRKLYIGNVVKKPVGSLDMRQLKSLSNSIRHVDNSFAYKSLNVLERILLEIEAWENNPIQQHEEPIPILKSIHVFSVLTAISRDIRKNKEGKKKNSRIAGLDSRGVKQLQNVVMLLKQLGGDEKSVYCDEGCYNEDVVSFATMISADASRLEKSGVDSALVFLGIMESEGGSEEWDPRLIGSVLNGLALWGRAEEAQSLLEKAMGLKIASTGSDDSTLTPSPRRLIPSEAEPCYNALLRAWSKVAIMASSKQVDSTSLTESRNALSRGNSILLHHIPAVPGLTISNRTCLAALQGYGALGLGDEAEQLLSKIETMLAATETSVMVSHLDSACYNSVLDAHSQSKQSAGMPRAKQLFDSMVKQQAITISNNDTTIEVLPPQADYISYSTMLNSYSKRGMADEAETLLKEMALASSTDSKAPLPTAASYLSVVRALERSNTENASERIMSLIENMRQLYENDNASKGNRKHPMPNRGIYISAIRFMSKCGKAIEAEQLYQNLRQTHPYSKSWTDIQACTLVLKAWGWTDQVTREEAAKRAANVLRDLESHVEEGHLKPLDVNVYNTMLNCYAKAGLVEETKALLKRMQPNGISYGLFIKAISKNNKSNAVDMAWKVLESLGYNSPKLSPIFDDSMEPFNSMLRLLAKRGLAADAESLLNTMDELYYDRKLNFRPNIQSYEAVLEALGRCKDSDTAIRAEAILTRMDVLQELGGTIQPSLMAYNHLINCYGNAGMSSRAERLLEQLQKNAVDSVTPDEYTIGSTIKAIINGGKSQENALTRVSTLVEGSRDGVDNKVIGAHQLKLYAKFGMGDEADELLRSMKRPGIIHYTIVLDSWAKNDSSDALERAEALFAEMEKHPDFTLDIAAYNSLLLNYSIRGLVDKAEKLVERIMLDPFLINRKTFTMLINAYNNAPMKQANAARRAEQLLDKMRELHALGNNEAEPDDVTYRSIIKCIRSGNVDAADHEKLALISRLQLEKWPYDR